MPAGNKYSAGPTMVLNWTPSGSTTVTAFSAVGRNAKINESMASAKATGYGNTTEQYVPTIADVSVDVDLLLDDAAFYEALFISGSEGTLDIMPAGNTTGKPKISIPSFVSKRDRSYPYDDVAVASLSFMPTSDKTETTVA